MYLFFKLLHILTAFWFVTGILGRQLTRAQARKSDDLAGFITLTTLAGRFESLMVIPGNLAVMVVGVIVALMGNWPIFGFLQGAKANWLLVSNLILLAGVFVVPLVYLPRGKVFDKVLEEAKVQGRITPELTKVLDDPVVKRAHWGEYIGVMVIIVLMVLKPF